MLVRLHLLNVTRATHEATLVRVTSLIGLVGKLHAAILTDVAIHMEVHVHRDDPHRLFSALDGSYSWKEIQLNLRPVLSLSPYNSPLTLSTAGALWGVHPMVVVDAVNLIIHVHCEWHPVQTLIAHAATEATRVIRFAHRLKDLEAGIQLNPPLHILLNPLLTISMIKWPQMAHFSAVCWKPEY